MSMTVVSKPLGELEIGHNIFRDGHIYTVTSTFIHEDDVTVTVTLGYPRRMESDSEPLKEITSHNRTLITVYQFH